MVSSVIVESPIPFEARQPLRIPFAGSPVQAGLPSPGEDWIENSIDLNEHIVSNPAATFFVRASGDSMRGAGISSGDILVVDRSVEPRDRQIVVAMLDGDFTVKRLRQRNGRVFLEAENPKFSPIEVVDQELMIWGAVTFVIHKPR
jgi:DNA polymerase V